MTTHKTQHKNHTEFQPVLRSDGIPANLMKLQMADGRWPMADGRRLDYCKLKKVFK